MFPGRQHAMNRGKTRENIAGFRTSSCKTRADEFETGYFVGVAGGAEGIQGWCFDEAARSEGRLEGIHFLVPEAGDQVVVDQACRLKKGVADG